MKNSIRYEYERVELPPGESLYFEHIHYPTQSDEVTHSRHFHEMHELMFYQNVQGSVWVDGNLYSMEGPHLVYIHPLAMHEYTWNEGTTSWFIAQFKKEMLNEIEFNTKMPGRSLVLPLDGVNLERVSTLFAWYNEQVFTGGDSNIRSNIFSLVLNWVCQQEPVTSHHVSSQGNKGIKKFFPLLNFIEKENRYSLSVEEAARICSLSRSYFLALFKEEFKITFHQFLLNRKINTAKLFLAERNMNISEIALQLEFQDSAYFSKVFKDEVSISPRDFRKSITGIKEKKRN